MRVYSHSSKAVLREPNTSVLPSMVIKSVLQRRIVWGLLTFSSSSLNNDGKEEKGKCSFYLYGGMCAVG
jgi:hypothetical protein